MTDPFLMVPHWIIRDSDLDKHEYPVYLSLLSHRNTAGYAWPSIATMAREARLSESGVKRGIKKLKDRGLLEIERRSYQSGASAPNRYRVADLKAVRNAPEFEEGEATDDVGGALTDVPPGHTDPLPHPQGPPHPSTVTYEEEPSKKNHSQEGFRSELTFAPAFIDDTPSTGQLDYLRDLFIHYNNEVPEQWRVEDWATRSKQEVSDAIDAFLKHMPRYDEYEGPQFGEDVFNELSAKGQQWADAGFIPID